MTKWGISTKSPSKAWCGDPDNVGNEIIYTAEPYEDVEMSECNANVNLRLGHYFV